MELRIVRNCETKIKSKSGRKGPGEVRPEPHAEPRRYAQITSKDLEIPTRAKSCTGMSRQLQLMVKESCGNTSLPIVCRQLRKSYACMSYRLRVDSYRVLCCTSKMTSVSSSG
ncbi:hypothetical protein E3N88_34787 [Mikania micrantha]|uniref:Uncharacterized protein n=1 Tax=Mikania micrantha TaxID=192012 RepID=A0A5N6LZ52_9ASTR|nr:hypothetical protein E3N88_34787 [Mikania micrantha]